MTGLSETGCQPTKILGRTNTTHGREFLKAWFFTDTSLTRHFELDQSFVPLCTRDLARRNHSDHETTAEPDIESRDTSQGR